MVNIVLISGSLRADSANTAALCAAAAHLGSVDPFDGQHPPSVAHAQIDRLPLYSEDVEDDGWPDPVEDLRNTVADADALIISTPEYNGSMPGGLKNALDWLSRPYGASILDGKAVATVSASPSAYGGTWAHDHLRHVLVTCGVRLINAEAVALPRIFEARDQSGEIADTEVLGTIRRLADEVLMATGLRASLEEPDGTAVAAP